MYSLQRLVLCRIIQNSEKEYVPTLVHAFRSIKEVKSLLEIANVAKWYKNCGFDIGEEAYTDLTEGKWYFDGLVAKVIYYFDSNDESKCKEFMSVEFHQQQSLAPDCWFVSWI
jgi:hypothetical protein